MRIDVCVEHGTYRCGTAKFTTRSEHPSVPGNLRVPEEGRTYEAAELACDSTKALVGIQDCPFPSHDGAALVIIYLCKFGTKESRH
jgi:hypothetical protein